MPSVNLCRLFAWLPAARGCQEHRRCGPKARPGLAPHVPDLAIVPLPACFRHGKRVRYRLPVADSSVTLRGRKRRARL
jgi:hypothetical protein